MHIHLLWHLSPFSEDSMTCFSSLIHCTTKKVHRNHHKEIPEQMMPACVAEERLSI